MTCPECGSERTCIGHDVTEIIELVLIDNWRWEVEASLPGVIQQEGESYAASCTSVVEVL